MYNSFMGDGLFIIQIFVGLVLLGLILVQVKGNGLGRVWGGWNMSFSKRGLEVVIFRATFVFAFLFVFVSLLSFIL